MKGTAVVSNPDLYEKFSPSTYAQQTSKPRHQSSTANKTSAT